MKKNNTLKRAFTTLLILGIISTLYGCTPTSKETQDETKKYEATHQVGKTESILENGPIQVAIHYPKTNIKALDPLIKDYIRQEKQAFSESNAEQASKNQSDEAFEAELNIDYESYLRDSIVSIKFTVFQSTNYLANPINKVSVLNYTEEGKALLRTSDFFKPGYEKTLTTLAKDKIEKKYKVTLDTDQLNALGEIVKLEDMNHIVIKKSGIDLILQQYEILPGNFGTLEISLKNDEVKKLLNEKYTSTDSDKLKAKEFKTVPEEAKKADYKMKIDTTKPTIALTFDDGPSIYTERIVTLLKENNAHATFFVLGNRLPDYGKELKAILANGNEIGNHTYNHRDLKKLSKDEIQAQLNQTDDLIQSFTQQKPTLMRPPYGSVDGSISAYINTPIVLWSLDTEDWKTKDKNVIANKILNNVKDGDIILMHDLYPASAEALEIVLPALKKKGFQVVTVSELYKSKNLQLKPYTIYTGTN